MGDKTEKETFPASPGLPFGLEDAGIDIQQAELSRLFGIIAGLQSQLRTAIAAIPMLNGNTLSDAEGITQFLIGPLPDPPWQLQKVDTISPFGETFDRKQFVRTILDIMFTLLDRADYGR